MWQASEKNGSCTFIHLQKPNPERSIAMKKTLLFILAAILLPLAVVAGILYSALFALSLLINTIMDVLDIGMDWVDKNITQNLR
jgi:hypothetical protein